MNGVRFRLTVLAAALVATQAVAQDGTFDQVKLRVSGISSDGMVMIDRGKRDRIAKGDLVILRTRDGNSFRGLVAVVLDRSAQVRMHDRTFKPNAGTFGEILVPASRPMPGAKTKPQEKPDPKQPEEKPGEGEKPTFRNQDEEYKKGMPLLAGVKPVRPEERGTQVSGRAYLIGVLSETERTGNDESYLRAGTDLNIENPFGAGGGMRFDGEYNYKTELTDIADSDLLVRQMSYYWGGTRFENRRVEVGRFLQQGMPEFQTLDGIEYGQRLDNRDRFGVSFGYMPQPDDDFESGRDLQFAAYYDLVQGDREELTMSAGLQKTWHKGKNDRDLFVGKIRYLPLESWDFNGSIWVDYYDGREQFKTKGFEVTQALASMGRRFKSGSGMDFTYRHIRHPELFRSEFRPLDPNLIAGDRQDRLRFNGWVQADPERRYNSTVTGWVDEQFSGGSFDVGIEQQNVILSASRLDITAFGSTGGYISLAGLRTTFGQIAERGRWDVMYEVGFHHHQGFPPDRDDLIQHRLRASRAFYTSSGWDMNFHFEGVLYDTDVSLAIGAYIQRSF